MAWPELPPRLSLLCAADCRGRVSVFASTLFPLAEVDVAGLAANASGAASGLHILQVHRPYETCPCSCLHPGRDVGCPQ